MPGGTSLVWTWFAVAWTYAILVVPILLLPPALGEHLGQLLAVAWSVTISALVVRRGILWRWIGWAGLVASVLYLGNQGDILATAVPGFPVFDLAGFLGSSVWACGCSPWAWPSCEPPSTAPPPTRSPPPHRPRAAGLPPASLGARRLGR